MKNIEQRSEFWGKIPDSGYGGGSEPMPYRKYAHLFNGKDLLEIGPGAGRQYVNLRELTNKYSVADISQLVLNKPIFSSIPKYHLTSHDLDLGKKFEMITFWYVVHHVLSSELKDFAKFVANHIKKDGYAYFNIPDSPKYSEGLEETGMKTTPHKLDDVLDAFLDNGFEIVDAEHLTIDSLNILCKKITD